MPAKLFIGKSLLSSHEEDLRELFGQAGTSNRFAS